MESVLNVRVPPFKELQRAANSMGTVHVILSDDMYMEISIEGFVPAHGDGMYKLTGQCVKSLRKFHMEVNVIDIGEATEMFLDEEN